MTVREASEAEEAAIEVDIAEVIEVVAEAAEEVGAETAADIEVAEAEEADTSNLITRKTWTTIKVAIAMAIKMEKKEQTD
jgi:hypothetical protein